MELPPLGDRVEPDALRELSDEDIDALGATLQGSERAIIAAMAPYEQHLREIRTRATELATERRRRERAQQVAQRAGVREAAKSGGMPSLAAALESPDEAFDPARSLSDVTAFLSSGGQVGFGFATRPGTMTFTDGRQQRQARTWGEARALHALGWDPGAPGVPGVRVHLAGSRVERVVTAGDVVLDVAATGSSDAAR
ncbi:MAG TPA: hypothetical protein VND88_05545 [Candidatus Acidoferrales bacterium]|nr:hypothetical protein [Candidatus Acidoferrales bacterium]